MIIIYEFQCIKARGFARFSTCSIQFLEFLDLDLRSAAEQHKHRDDQVFDLAIKRGLCRTCFL